MAEPTAEPEVFPDEVMKIAESMCIHRITDHLILTMGSMLAALTTKQKVSFAEAAEELVGLMAVYRARRQLDSDWKHGCPCCGM